MDTGSEALTNGIRVRVQPEFVPDGNVQVDAKYVWSYRITIINEGDEWVKLLARHWVIINDETEKEEVTGEGVVGYTPELKPGDSFTYSSFCPLNTPWGTMEGTFQMRRNDGTMFEARVERFFLLSPEAQNANDDN